MASSSPYGTVGGWSPSWGPRPTTTTTAKKSPVYNYDIAKIEQGYGREWEDRNNASEIARRDHAAYDAANMAGLAASDMRAQQLFDQQMKQYREDQARQAERDRLDRAAEARRVAQESAERSSALDSFAREFGNLGLDEGQIKAALKTIGQYDYRNMAKLQDAVRSTQTWADRFGAVTKARRDKGMDYLDEGQIAGLESEYRQALSGYGLPASFYDQPEDFQNWISNDVSVAEVKDRADLASAMANSVDQGTKDAFSQYWGVGTGDMTAYFLDRTRATDLLTKQVKAAEALASEANAAKVGGTSAGFFEDLAGKDISRQEFRQAAERTGVTGEDWKRLAQVSGQNLTQSSLLSANLGLDVDTTKKLKKLSSQERGRFTGSGGGTTALGSSRVGAY